MPNISNCISCGTKLTIINLGKVDDMFCQKCEEIKLELLTRDIPEEEY